MKLEVWVWSNRNWPTCWGDDVNPETRHPNYQEAQNYRRLRTQGNVDPKVLAAAMAGRLRKKGLRIRKRSSSDGDREKPRSGENPCRGIGLAHV